MPQSRLPPLVVEARWLRVGQHPESCRTHVRVTASYGGAVTAPRPTDEQLIAHAARSGFKVTPRKLSDWRRAGAMPEYATAACLARIVGLCEFLGRTGQFTPRPDLPGRRVVTDATPW